MTRILKQTLEEWSLEARVPPDMADRALRRRPRWRGTRFAGAVSCAALVAAVALLVPLVVLPRLASHHAPATAPHSDVLPVQPYRQRPVTVGGSNVLADNGDFPPKTEIAAGRVAVSAYFTTEFRDLGHGRRAPIYTWYLLNPVTRAYEKTAWGWAEVAPGLRWAAVLEKNQPVRRIGIFDMKTRQVRAWVPLSQPVRGVRWSPDGTRLLATVYGQLPGETLARLAECPSPGASAGAPKPSASARARASARRVTTGRVGFSIIDVATATASGLRVIDPCLTKDSVQLDFDWSDDGTLIYDDVQAGWRPASFYDLNGRPHKAPAGYVMTQSLAGVSPNGKLLAAPGLASSASSATPPTKVTDRASGKVVGRQHVFELLAWADDDHLIGLGCVGSCATESEAGVVLVSVDGKRTVPLSFSRTNKEKTIGWAPILTLR